MINQPINLWADVPDEITEALKITGKNNYQLIASEQFDAYYSGRIYAYPETILKGKFWIILEDSKWMIDALKLYEGFKNQLLDAVNYVKVEKMVNMGESGSLNTSVATDTAVSKNTNTLYSQTKGNNTEVNKTKSKSGNTDANSYADPEIGNKYLDIAQPDMPAMRAFAAVSQSVDNTIGGLSNQLNYLLNESTDNDTSNATNLNKSTSKSDMMRMSYTTAESILKILNAKIPAIRSLFFKRFSELFLNVY